jgi:hypothetical protein
MNVTLNNPHPYSIDMVNFMMFLGDSQQTEICHGTDHYLWNKVCVIVLQSNIHMFCFSVCPEQATCDKLLIS